MHAGGQWKPAQDVFEQMPACGCKPDAVSYAILISAYDRGNQWCRALQVLYLISFCYVITLYFKT